MNRIINMFDKALDVIAFIVIFLLIGGSLLGGLLYVIKILKIN